MRGANKAGLRQMVEKHASGASGGLDMQGWTSITQGAQGFEGHPLDAVARERQLGGASSSSSAAASRTPSGPIPAVTFLLFDSPPPQGQLQRKLVEFNAALAGEAESSSLALTAEELAPEG